jgi:hypothetical protein
MFTLKDYNDNPQLFTIAPLIDNEKMADDGNPTVAVLYKSFNEFSGVTSDMAVQFNHFKLQQQSAYFAQKIAEMTEQKQWVDTFLADCAKAGQ